MKNTIANISVEILNSNKSLFIFLKALFVFLEKTKNLNNTIKLFITSERNLKFRRTLSITTSSSKRLPLILLFITRNSHTMFQSLQLPLHGRPRRDYSRRAQMQTEVAAAAAAAAAAATAAQ